MNNVTANDSASHAPVTSHTLGNGHVSTPVGFAPDTAATAPTMEAPVHAPVSAPLFPAAEQFAAVVAPPAVPAAEAPVAQFAQTHAIATPMPPTVETVRPVSVAPVDQIDDSEPFRSTPRPARRRNRDVAPSEPLVFIETVATTPAIAPLEEEAPRRRTPRPRAQRPASAEPLLFVETANPGNSAGDDKSAI
jgi:hypothetical protein